MPRTASRGPGRPPAAKAADTRDRILTAAQDVFSESGYNAATFQAIAQRADLTRPAINHYFPSKRALFGEVGKRVNARVVAAGVERAQRAHTLTGRLEAFLAAAVQVDSEDRSAAAFLVVSVLEAQRHPALAQDQNGVLEASRAFVAWAVNDAVSTGELSTETDVPALVELLVAMLWGMGFYAGFVGGHQQLERITEQFTLLIERRL